MTRIVLEDQAPAPVVLRNEAFGRWRVRRERDGRGEVRHFEEPRFMCRFSPMAAFDGDTASQDAEAVIVVDAERERIFHDFAWDDEVPPLDELRTLGDALKSAARRG